MKLFLFEMQNIHAHTQFSLMLRSFSVSIFLLNDTWYFKDSSITFKLKNPNFTHEELCLYFCHSYVCMYTFVRMHKSMVSVSVFAHINN